MTPKVEVWCVAIEDGSEGTVLFWETTEERAWEVARRYESEDGEETLDATVWKREIPTAPAELVEWLNTNVTRDTAI